MSFITGFVVFVLCLGGGRLLFSGGKWRWGESETAGIGGNLKGVEEETVVIMYKKRMYF